MVGEKHVLNNCPTLSNYDDTSAMNEHAVTNYCPPAAHFIIVFV
jgi:hypothetical protein